KGGLRSHQKQYPQQKYHAIQIKTCSGSCHQYNLDKLDVPDKSCLVPFISQLTGSGRKKEKWQDKNPGRQRDHDLRTQTRFSHGGRSDQDNQCVLENIVIERPQELSDEKRQKAPA